MRETKWEEKKTEIKPKILVSKEDIVEKEENKMLTITSNAFFETKQLKNQEYHTKQNIL